MSVDAATVDGSHWLRDGDELRAGNAIVRVELGAGGGRLVVRDARDEDLTGPVPLVAAAAETPSEATATAIEPVAFAPSRGAAAPARRRSLLVPFVTSLLLVALAAVAFFVFTAKTVIVEIEPPPDVVRFADTPFAFELGGNHLLRPGRYTLVAEKAGYRRLEAPVEIGRDARQTLRFTLDKLPGTLRVVVRSPAFGDLEEATVEIGGEAAGTAPLVAELAAGQHPLRVRAERHLDLETMVEVIGGGTEQTFVAELVPAWAPVRFASRPAGASVRVDGRELGTTPVTLDLAAGRRAVQLVLGGFRPHRLAIDVVADQALELPPVALVPAAGNLSLSSTPEGAAVSVGGTYRGTTPLDLELPPGAAHRVEMSIAGHEPSAAEVTLKAGEARALHLDLPPLHGELQVALFPPDAELLVDGELQTVTSEPLQLVAVPHEVEVRRAGFLPYRGTVTPLPGVRQRLEVQLESEEEAFARAHPPVLETAAGHRMHRIDPGALQMGASRREPGRRANEVLRQVELTRRFYLAAHEVSNAQFRRFRPEHSSAQIAGRTLDLDNQPAVRLTWQDAAAYCNWLSAREGLPAAYVLRDGVLEAAEPMTIGYRLPTEAEWVWAARYPGPRKFTWGNAMPVPAGAGNWADASAAGIVAGTLADYDDGFPVTAPVTGLAAGPRGLHHLGGNVAEWIHDFYAVKPSGERDPLGPPSGEFHVIRGASWMHSSITELRLSFRDYGADPRPDLGFRVARYFE